MLSQHGFESKASKRKCAKPFYQAQSHKCLHFLFEQGFLTIVREIKSTSHMSGCRFFCHVSNNPHEGVATFGYKII